MKQATFVLTFLLAASSAFAGGADRSDQAVHQVCRASGGNVVSASVQSWHSHFLSLQLSNGVGANIFYSNRFGDDLGKMQGQHSYAVNIIGASDRATEVVVTVKKTGATDFDIDGVISDKNGPVQSFRSHLKCSTYR